jgi:CRISPR system Cascade subunit CasD
MVAGACGIDRESDQRMVPGVALTLADLAGLKMGVRVDREGVLMDDFQTAAHEGTPTANGKYRQGPSFFKFYISDAAFLVGLEGSANILAAISDALRTPHWAPCLGRRGCIPSKPLVFPDGGIRQLPLVDALRQEPLSGVPRECRFIVEVPVGKGTRRVTDVPLCFASANRRFGAREVREFIEKVPKGA